MKRLAQWFAIFLILAVTLTLVVPWGVARWLGPRAREEAIALLEDRFDHVELRSLELEVAPGFHFLPSLVAVGQGLRLTLPGRDSSLPFLTMNEFRVELGALGLLRTPRRVRHLSLDELVIQIPPPRKDASDEPRKEAPPAFLVEELVADGAVLRILPKSEDKTPLTFDLHELRVDSAGIEEPMAFESLLDNPKPPGTIRTRGSFGPFVLSNAGRTPVSGEYVFDEADLSVFGGIAGTLRSEGRFDGVLGEIEVEGSTTTPGFQLTSAGNPVELTTEFEATVDGTNGDTLLHPVRAVLGASRFETRGGVVTEPGSGKAVCLDAETSKGRIEDFLRLAMKSEPPLMTGDVHFLARIVIPPGDVDVAKKMILDGEVSIEAARFPSSAIQSKVDDLSAAGRGSSREDDESRVRDVIAGERVFSDIHGDFLLRDGIMTLSHLSFAVPGARVTLVGTYGLLTETIDFQGELRLDASISETQSGLKSLLLKLVDPLFRRDGAGAVIPIRIEGSPEDPSYGVDFSRVLSRADVTSPDEDDFQRRPWPTPWEACATLPTLAPDAEAAPAKD